MPFSPAEKKMKKTQIPPLRIRTAYSRLCSVEATTGQGYHRSNGRSNGRSLKITSRKEKRLDALDCVMMQNDTTLPPET